MKGVGVFGDITPTEQQGQAIPLYTSPFSTDVAGNEVP